MSILPGDRAWFRKMKIPSVRESIVYYPLQGGEDLVTPAIDIDPGRLLISQNYECDRDGHYRVIDGYEVFDGHPKPSEASYWILNTTGLASAPAANSTVTGQTSGATGLVVTSEVSDQYLVLTNVSGSFQDGENLQISGTTIAQADGTAVEGGASTTTLHDTYLHAAIELARGNISAVPGSGDILGFWQYNGIKYAFRNNSDGTEAKMYKSSATGWTLCDLGFGIDFTSGGTYEIKEGDVITGDTSGATATVIRVVLRTGTWAGGDAEGRLILTNQTGNFVSETLDVGGTLDVATVAGDSTTHTLNPNGRFEFVNYNFYGSSNYWRMYGCDGENPAFEWDGTVFVPIQTGMTVDKPKHIAVYRNHLFLSFPGGSLQYSSTGDPYGWNPLTGSAELGIGEEITKLAVLNGPVLVVQGRNLISLLYGSGSSDWELKPYTDQSGCIEWTGQVLGTCIYLDDRGLTTIYSTQKYGDYISSTISKDIQPYLDTKMSNVQCSVAARQKGQYRLYFDDGEGICLTLDGSKILGFTRLKYDVVPICMYSTDNLDGEEEIFFGTSDGYVYQLDSGTSFNGNPLKRFLRLPYNHLKTPRNYKDFKKIILEMETPNGTEIDLYVDFSYGEDLAAKSQSVDIDATGGYWGYVKWGSFTWSGPTVGRGQVYIDGTGTNFSLLLVSESTYVEPHTLQGITVQYTIRGIER